MLSRFQFFIFLTFSFLYAAYTANIVSLLQSPSKNIRTIEDLVKSKIQLASEDTPYLRYFFAKVDRDIDIKVYKKVAPPGQKDHFVKAEHGIGLVRKGLYAILMEESVGFKIIEDTFYEHEKCELENVQGLKFSYPFLSLAKRSPYKEILKVK